MKILRCIRSVPAVAAMAAMAALAALIGLAVSPTGSRAQSGPAVNFGNADVTVDLSVIDDGGYGSSPGVPLPGGSLPELSGRRLLMPGPQMPTSRLYFAVPGNAAAPDKPVQLAAPTQPPTIPRSMPAPVARAPSAPPSPPKVKEPMAAPKAPKAAPLPTVITAAPLPPPPAAKPEPVPAANKQPPPAPPPPAVTARKTPPAPAQPREQASRPPAQASMAPGRALQLPFAESAAKISTEAQSQLKTLASQLQEQTGLRLQLMAYAGGKALSSSKARRLSLSRALSVRAFLIENGVRSTRIDVRALGNKTTDEPLNRVDVMVVDR